VLAIDAAGRFKPSDLSIEAGEQAQPEADAVIDHI